MIQVKLYYDSIPGIVVDVRKVIGKKKKKRKGIKKKSLKI